METNIEIGYIDFYAPIGWFVIYCVIVNLKNICTF